MQLDSALKGAWARFQRTGDWNMLWKHGAHSIKAHGKKVSTANDAYYIIISKIFKKSEHNSPYLQLTKDSTHKKSLLMFILSKIAKYGMLMFKVANIDQSACCTVD